MMQECKISFKKMKRESKKDLKKIADVYPEIIQLQIEDYCPTSYRVVVINAFQTIEEEND